MSEQIDWSKAPEGAIGHGNIGIGHSYVWFSDKWYKYVDSNHGGRHYFGDTCVYSEKDIVSRTHRPTTQSWSGEGLPPVGADIEVKHELYGWIGARVVGQDGEAAIVRTNDGYAGVFPHQMRQIRTPEQIAADEREAAVAEMLGLFGGADSRDTYLMQRLYDAGYRKQSTCDPTGYDD